VPGIASHPSNDVAAVFAAYPETLRAELLELRRLILETAGETEGVGAIKEALRWGEPSYLTTESNSGSTIRIGPVASDEQRYAVYFNCHTTLVETFRQTYPDLFSYSGTRAITFRIGEPVQSEALKHCLALALCHHRAKPSAI
jgi:hypothetical protein